ncbi:hypothetical protein vBPaerPsCh_178c [Pseudomonas phage vB_Paer_PsCh]|uniref:Uncharacterized protein n=1 Tax=Pseudomonas phage vB_Paer_PsCh TaxID=2924906 RepID=A0AAE9GMH9_9CAUD|nr:hypothetical protein QE349_gp178 [Pseudomonas phage vB_Paer_PsCh]UOL48009.1 hypothetical protein vBPaerPsCh_178c [Pseudomonas phage vB_Paer_PsCh]
MKVREFTSVAIKQQKRLIKSTMIRVENYSEKNGNRTLT